MLYDHWRLLRRPVLDVLVSLGPRSAMLDGDAAHLVRRAESFEELAAMARWVRRWRELHPSANVTSGR